MSQQLSNTIQHKVEAFTKKFYRRELFKGLIISLSGLTGLFLLFITTEYFFRFSGNLRAFLFYSFLIIFSVAFLKNVGIPLAKYYGLMKRISPLDAAHKIGEHFPEIGDKLVNTIQLQSTSNNDLTQASIEQKSIGLKPFEFKDAVTFENLTKISRWAIIPILLVILLGSINPNLLKNGTHRIINYNENFAPENPFKFKLLNENLNVFRNHNLELSIEIIGDEKPQDVYLISNQQKLRFKKLGANQFVLLLRNLQNSVNFKIKTDDFFSSSYAINMIEKPVMSNLFIQAKFPKYTNKKNEEYTNTGNVIVPQGTELSWTIQTKECENLSATFMDTTLQLIPKNDLIRFAKKINESSKYSISVRNRNDSIGEAITYTLSVIKDEFPDIKIINFPDSINPLMLYHSGVIGDDYGIKKLTFNYKTADTVGVINVPIQKNTLQQSFNHSINLGTVNIKKGAEISYYFEVFDNDGVNGSKSSKSVTEVYKLPSKDDIDDLLADNNENIKEKLNDNLKKAQELQKEFDEIKKSLLEKKEMDWSDKARVEKFLENQKSFEKQIEKLNFENQKNNFQREQLSPQEEEILKKQEQINELFEQLMDEETQKLYDELEQLMEEMNKDKTNDVLEKIDLSNEELEKELDRTLELFKQMEFDQKLEESIKKLEELAKEQDKLSEETLENEEAKNEELAEKQEELNKEFEDIQKDIQDLKAKNEELENKKPMDDMQSKQDEIKENQEKSKEELSKGNKKKSSKSQKKAAEKMQEMAQDMKKMQQEMEEQQQAEDINSLRQILENLISFSVNQESLMQTFKNTSRFDPQFPILAKQQGDLKEGAKIIHDSLQALSKRQIALESIINKELLEINYNMDKSIDYLRERDNSSAGLNQQYIMTSANNLALILDESLQQMQQQMMSKQNGTGSCSKPGAKPGGMKGAKQMQKMLNQQIQQMKKEMQEGKKPGKKGKNGNKGMAKGLAKMAAQQGAIKEQLRKINEEQKKQGKGGIGELENLQNQMEETERDILNKNITRETIQRQQNIMTKLLEAEKALREREFDDKRESKKGKTIFKRNPKEFEPYKTFKLDEQEQLKTVPPSFNLYYKRKINEYFNTFDE